MGIVSNSKSTIYKDNRNMVYTFVFAMFFVCVTPVYTLGNKEPPSSGIDNLKTLEEDPHFKDFIGPKLLEKPSLEYLTQLHKARMALYENNLLLSLQLYLDLQTTYGNISEIVFGIGESYYALGDRNNALLYYPLLINTDDDSQGMFDKNEKLSHYRLAQIYYQLDNMDIYIEELRYIISQSLVLEDALIGLMQTESLDKILALFKTDIDYSYIAQRELGTFFAFSQDKVGDEALIALITALSMATHSFSEYLAVQEIGYQYTDLLYMIELLKMTTKGRQILNSFYISRILISVRKYYNASNTEHMKYMSNYCTQLLELLGFYETENSEQLYIYVPYLR